MKKEKKTCPAQLPVAVSPGFPVVSPLAQTCPDLPRKKNINKNIFEKNKRKRKARYFRKSS